MDQHFQVKAQELAEAVDCGNTKRAAAVLSTDFDSNPREAMALMREERAREQARGSSVHLDIDANGELVFRDRMGNSVSAGPIDPSQFAGAENGMRLPAQAMAPVEQQQWGGPQQFLPAQPGDANAWNQGAAPPEPFYPPDAGYQNGIGENGYPFQNPAPPWAYAPQPPAAPYYDAAPVAGLVVGTALAGLVTALSLGGREHRAGWMAPRYRFHR
ncbi:MAG TPA: hypothetical protein V6C81_12530 [Planktothrix sp.]